MIAKIGKRLEHIQRNLLLINGEADRIRNIRRDIVSQPLEFEGIDIGMVKERILALLSSWLSRSP